MSAHHEPLARIVAPMSAAPLSLGEEVCLLYAASLGLLDASAAEGSAEAAYPRLLEYVRAEEPELMAKISETGLFGESAKERLAELIAAALEQQS